MNADKIKKIYEWLRDRANMVSYLSNEDLGLKEPKKLFNDIADKLQEAIECNPTNKESCKSLPFTPKFKYKDIIYNNTTQEVRIVMDACVQNSESGYCVDYLNGACDWLSLSDENNWNKIGEVTSDVKPWIKKDLNSVTDITILTVRNKFTDILDVVMAFRKRYQCLNQVRELFKKFSENFDKITEDAWISELDRKEFIETKHCEYSINTCYI